MQLLSGQSIGRYHILEQLGEGGMAVVYKAYDTRLEREVAVKVIRTEQLAPAMLGRALVRFEREAKELSKLNHPNIVNVYDYGEYEGVPYLVMTYLNGGTLKQKLGSPIPYCEAIHLVIPIARALDYAHRHKMIHRDVKPSNILITDSGDVMLTDFGIAKILDLEEGNTLTGTGLGLGTPEYMAPEQWTGQFTPAVDIYSLGVVLYELVTGRKPYTADTPAAILLKQATEPLPRPKELIPELPEEVERVLFKVLAKRPEDRYVDMAAFAAALERLEREQPATVPAVVRAAPVIKGAADAYATYDQYLEEKGTEQPVKSVTIPLVVARQTQPAPDVQTTQVAHHTSRILAVIISVVVMVLLAGITSGWFSPRPAAPAPTEAPKPTLTYSVLTQVLDNDGMTMVYVPAGEFLMGSPDGVGYDSEHPQHTVYLDGYWIDQTEVTNAMYEKCVADGACTQPTEDSSYTRNSYYGNTDYDNFPVIHVNWNQAEAYCSWAGRELPTEAQWEKAARGTDGRIFPWGNELPTCEQANIGSCVEDTIEVGSYPDGASPYGALDMVGNVWEWVADWYAVYPSSKDINPKGPTDGVYRVARGSSWGHYTNFLYTTRRSMFNPNDSSNGSGFRCSTKDYQISEGTSP